MSQSPDRYNLFKVAFGWDLTEETIHLPLGCHDGDGPNRTLDVGMCGLYALPERSKRFDFAPAYAPYLCVGSEGGRGRWGTPTMAPAYAPHRVASLTRKRVPPGTYSRPMARVLGGS